MSVPRANSLAIYTTVLVSHIPIAKSSDNTFPRGLPGSFVAQNPTFDFDRSFYNVSQGSERSIRYLKFDSSSEKFSFPIKNSACYESNIKIIFVNESKVTFYGAHSPEWFSRHATKMIDGGGSCEYQQRPLATDLPISNMQFPTDPPRSTICYGDGDVQGIYQQRSWLTRC